MINQRMSSLVPILYSVLLSVVLYGCHGVTVGGYEHHDMSRSAYKEEICQQAKQLATSGHPDDLKTAAELYGSIGMLEPMDWCVMQYFKQDPDGGKYLLVRADKIHAYYGRQK